MVSDTHYNNNTDSYKPGILLKTIYALNKHKNKYDYYFRTNLSSIILLDKFKYYINNINIQVAGWIIPDNETVCKHNVKKFISGCCILFNNVINNKLLNNLDLLDYNETDDISISKFFIQNNCDLNKINILRFDNYLEKTIFQILDEINSDSDKFFIRSDRRNDFTLNSLYNILSTYKLLY